MSKCSFILLFLFIFCSIHFSDGKCQARTNKHIISAHPPIPHISPHFKNTFRKIIFSVSLGVFLGLTVAVLFSFAVRSFFGYLNRTPILRGSVIFSPKINPKTLQSALKVENQLLGSSPNGKMSRTVLDNGLTVAVKQLEPFETGQSNSVKRRAQQELETLAGLRHRNLLSLRAYIREEDRFSLIYDYAPSGSLDDVMKKVRENQLQLSWEIRLRIAVGLVKGLHYLHFECQPPILHCNLKPSNVIMDAEFEPRLADCGLAKLIPRLGRTTSAYSAPECLQNGRYTNKSDIFSFGMILAILLTSRDVDDPIFKESSNWGSLAGWLWIIDQSGESREVALDRNMTMEEGEEDQMLMAVKIAVVCLSDIGRPATSCYSCSLNCTVFETAFDDQVLGSYFVCG